MSGDFEKKIEELFLGNSISISAEQLENILKESFSQIQSKKDLNEQNETSNVTADDILKFLPKMEFTEDVGELKSSDRQQFEMLIGGTLKSKSSIEEKVKYLQDFTKNIRGRTTQNILSSLMVLKMLQNIIKKASAGSAGLQTEAFIAGILGGTQIKRDARQNVVDVEIKNEDYQLKVLTAGGDIIMSGDNMRKHFSSKDILKFIIVYKNSPTELEFKTFQLTNKFLSENEKFSEMIKSAKQFVINPDKDGEQLKITSAGVINIEDQVFNSYNELLKQNVRDVLVQTANLINNINLFYIQNSPSAAGAGAQNAGTISGLLTKEANK